MVNRIVSACVVVAALTLPAPAQAWVFPFFEPEPIAGAVDDVVTLDFDGDGRPDVAGISRSAGTVTLVRNGAGGFGAPQTVTVPGKTEGDVALAAADLDGDGRDELLATLGDSGTLLVFAGGELGAPAVHALRDEQPVRATAVDTGDVDGDGDVDVVAAFGTSATVLVNDGGTLTPAAGAVTIPTPYDLELVALGGDDDPDLVVLSGFTLAVLNGADAAGFGPPVSHELGDEGAALATGDVDGDGRTDVAVAYQIAHGSPPGLFKGTSTGGLQPLTGGGVNAEALLLADFDGDGGTDRYSARYSPAFAHGIAGAFSVHGWAQEDGDHHWERAVATADFDGDGMLDVVSARPALTVRTFTGPQLVPSDANTWLGQSTVGTTGGPMIAVPVRNQGGGVARDLEAVVDGDADFVVDLHECGDAVLAVGDQCWMRVWFRAQAVGERSADIGVVAENSGIVWLGVGIDPPPAPAPTPTETTHGFRPPTPREAQQPTPRTMPPKAVRPAAPTLKRTTLASLRRSGLRFQQSFGTAERVTWTLEHRGTVLARVRRTVTVGRVSVTLKLTATGKRVLAKRKPKSLTLRTKGTLDRVTTVKVRSR